MVTADSIFSRSSLATPSKQDVERGAAEAGGGAGWFFAPLAFLGGLPVDVEDEEEEEEGKGI